ncbi:MAG: hypothetical protein P4L31_02920 [Candidatus Babeliales bacterium]|nr:hypothetical protein [Candidatus Babeliales bacterium]
MKKLFFVFLCCNTLLGKDVDESNIIQEKKGNIALRPSQQPSPLFSFGQLIVDKYTVQPQIDINLPKINNEKNNSIIFSLLYGMTDYLSVFINIPVATNITVNNQKSSGLGDIFAQFELLVHSKSDVKSTAQTTLVGTILFPTGSTITIPPIGNQASGFFLGSTYSYLATDWYYYASGGYQIATRNQTQKKPGNQLLYQAGIGHSVGNPWGCIFSWFFEFNGTYEQHTTINNRKDRNTGGNSIYLGPTVWISSEKFFLETGIAFPIVQNLNGKQNKTEYVFGLDIGVTLH